MAAFVAKLLAVRGDSHSRRTVRLLAETLAILLALAAVAGWSLAALAAPLDWIVILAAALLQGLWFDRLYTVAHEAVHRKLFPDHPRLNDLVGALLMLPIVAPLSA